MRKLKEQMTFSYVHHIVMVALCRLMLEGLTSVSLCAPMAYLHVYICDCQLSFRDVINRSKNKKEQKVMQC